MIRNPSLTLETITKSAATTRAVQEKSDSLAKVSLDNKTGLKLSLNKEGIYVLTNTTCYTWINTSEEDGTQAT